MVSQDEGNSRTAISIGLFERTLQVEMLISPLLRNAGCTVHLCSDASLPLETFLQTIIDHDEPTGFPPYDGLILAISSHDLTGQARTLLDQWVSFSHLPVLLLTDMPLPERGRPLLLSVQPFPFLSRYIFSVPHIVGALEQLIGRAIPFTGPNTAVILRWHRAQFQDAIQKHQSWIDQRQEWLRQQGEWLQARRAWLGERARWLSNQRQRPGAQHDWLDEQQTWVDTQQEEVNRQERALSDRQRWLTQQQRKLDHVKLPLLKWA